MNSSGLIRSFLALVLLLSCLSLATALPVQDRAQIPGSSGQHFWLNGEPFRFIGYNVRGFVHYGYHDILYWAQAQDQPINAQVVQNTGGRVIRVFGSNKYISNQELGDRLEYALSIAEAYNFYILYAFTDYYYTGFNPMGDCKYYSSSGGWTLLNHAFFSGGYQENYLPQVTYLVNRFKHHKRIFAWQLGNEIKHPSDPTVFYNFCMDMHQVIRSIDPYHMISVGLISTWPHTGWTNEQATAIHSTFDFLTFHPYNGAESDEHERANAVGKPLLIGEAGFSEGNRPQNTSNDIAKWVGRGARGYLQWGLMSTPYDNGDGDRLFGVDRVFHADDWDAYLQMYTNWAQQLANTPSPPSQTPKGMTASQGTHNDRVVVSWDFEPSAKQYAVFRSTTPSGDAVQVSPWQLDIEFADTTVIPGTTYYYRVKARNDGGESSLSSAVSGWARLDAYGTVSGSILDQDSNPVGGAVVALNPGEHSTVSQANGSYIIETLPPGTYDMSVLKSGFRPAYQTGIAVLADQTTLVNVYLQPTDSMTEAKGVPDGSPASVSGIVTAVFPTGGQSRIYAQSPDRSGGIAVSTDVPLSEGDEIVVEGYMTTLDGERVLSGAEVFITGTGAPSPRPLSMPNRALGGGHAGMQSAVLDDASTDEHSVGLNNVGLLVKSWGQVTYVSPDGAFFYMDDGSGISDGFGQGVRVACAGLPTPSEAATVSITGISGATMVSGKVVRLLRPRSMADLSYVDQIELVNPGFETGTTSGWTVFGSIDGVHTSFYGSITAHSGGYFLGSASHWGIKNGGVYQTVSVPTGIGLQAKAWSRVYWLANYPESTQNRVGIDPTGGTDPNAAAVQWSPWDIQQLEGYSEWRQISTPTVQSTNGYATVFLDMYMATSQEWKVNCFDDAELLIVTP